VFRKSRISCRHTIGASRILGSALKRMLLGIHSVWCLALCETEKKANIIIIRVERRRFARLDMNTPKEINYFVFYIIMPVVVFVVTYNCYLSASHPLQPSKLNSMTNATLCVTGRPCTYTDVMDFRVIVITFNRPDSLSKLLRSLDTLVLDADRAALEIWIDRNRDNRVDQRTVEVASAFSWKKGSSRVHIQVALYLERHP